MKLFDPGKPPPLPPFQQDAFKSRLRIERVIVRLGIPLAICIFICFFTGLFSHYQQHPPSWLHIPPSPTWLFRLTQGLHVATGTAAIVLVFFKLWAVYVNLWIWPPVRSVVHAFERLLTFVLVAALLFQLTTGLINLSQWYPWKFGFTQTHFAMAFAVVGALLLHLAFKAPGIVRALRAPVPHDPPPGENDPDREAEVHIDNNAAYTDEDLLVTGGISRRGLFIAAGTAVGAITAVTVGQTLAPLQDIALLAPRRPDIGPQGVPVNKTAAHAGITQDMVGPGYRLVVDGPRRVQLSIDELYALEQSESELPIACVEGWSSVGLWGGVRLSTLLDLAGISPQATIRATSLEPRGTYATSELQPQFARDPLTLLALHLAGEVLVLDHGYPARIIAPNRPGVLQTKWITRLEAV